MKTNKQYVLKVGRPNAPHRSGATFHYTAGAVPVAKWAASQINRYARSAGVSPFAVTWTCTAAA